MSSGITFSGFNNIDFNTVLNAIMQQESQPLRALQSRQTAMQSRASTFGTLVSRVSALQSAADALSDAQDSSSFSASSNDATSLGVSASSSATPGRYEVVVNDLARAQVMASASSAPDADNTVVASGGSVVIEGYAISIAGPVTLKQLAEAINSDSNAPVRASVVQASASNFRLVLTSKNTGAANAFTVTNNLTGGSGVAFTDTDNDGVSGDSAADNAVQASDASLLVNNIAVTSASNTIDNVVPGVTLSLYKKDPAATIVVDVTSDTSALKNKLQSFVSAYNDYVKFVNDQNKAASDGDTASIGRDPLVRQLRNLVRGSLTSEYATGGEFSYLSQVGVQLTQAGTLELNEATFNEATSGGTDAVATLLAGTAGTPGALKSITTMLTEYTQTHGILFEARDQLTHAADRLDKQIADMEDRLSVRRLALQQEFTAADMLMSRLKSQSSSLSSVSL